MHAATFAAIFAALYVAHVIADHWVQTQHQADHKGDDGWPGRIACAAHVATYTVTQLVALGLVIWRCDLAVSPAAAAAGVAVSTITHYIADRRTPLQRIAEALGSGPLYQIGAVRPGRDDNPSLGTGAYALDQSWHVAWLFVAALIMA